jgi:uncharacterized membrane protein
MHRKPYNTFNKIYHSIQDSIYKSERNKVAGIIFILFALIYFLIVICNHYFFRTACFDYGAYNFAFYDFSHFRVSLSPVYYHNEHMTFLQDHVSFTFFFFIPLYWTIGWFSGTYTLLLVQNFFILFGAWAVYKLVILKTEKKLLALLALLQYFILAGRWTTFSGDCNLAVIASSMVPVFLYYFEKKKFSQALIALVFIILTREDMSLWTTFIGFFLLVTHYKDTRLKFASISVIVLSLLYFVLVFKFIIPALETPEKKFDLFQYTALGKNPYEALFFIIKNPVKTFTLLFVNTTGNKEFDGLKVEFYIYYFVCGGFILFLRPKYILLFIPILAKKMLNDEPIRWSMEWYYSIEFVSILPIAVFLIISELKNKTLSKILTLTICITTFFYTIYKLDGHRKMNWWGDNKYAFYKSKMYKADFDVKRVYRYLSNIPPEAEVSATECIIPHLAFRPKIHCFPRINNSEYLIFLLNKSTYPISKDQFSAELKKIFQSLEWKIEINDYPLLILKRNKVYN